jgi:hypothetical protein
MYDGDEERSEALHVSEAGLDEVVSDGLFCHEIEEMARTEMASKNGVC